MKNDEPYWAKSAAVGDEMKNFDDVPCRPRPLTFASVVNRRTKLREHRLPSRAVSLLTLSSRRSHHQQIVLSGGAARTGLSLGKQKAK